ncbi:MAG: TlpA family protein disulfide reductase [Motiliproteus sp.]|nr:TlpA family protein disulfide reductase [Motiliproteus sp.]MCW9053086.1 TlpA family protein disulfide reductase [Motiliproteus sp.]
MRSLFCYPLIVLMALLIGCTESSKPANLDGWVDNGRDLSDLELVDLAGNSKDLADYHGKNLVINFWATWCAPCRKEMPALQALSDQLDPEHYAVIGVTVDQKVEPVNQFLSENGIRFQQFIDPQMDLAMSELKVRAFPETLIVNAEGKVLRRILGPREWDDESYYRQILP